MGQRWLVTRALPQVAVAVVGVVGCVVPPTYEPLPPELDAVALTREGQGSYGASWGNGTLTLMGPAVEGGGNTRTVLWPRDSPVSADHLSCATWTGQSESSVQQGAALRIQPTPGGVRAVTVTKNVWGPHRHIFNVHVWDTEVTSELNLVGRVDLSPHLGSVTTPPPPLPWRMCARAAGSTVEVKVWALPAPEPAWGDPSHGGTVELPPGWDTPGRAGWYAGHLLSGQAMGSTDLVPALPAAS